MGVYEPGSAETDFIDLCPGNVTSGTKGIIIISNFENMPPSFHCIYHQQAGFFLGGGGCDNELEI